MRRTVAKRLAKRRGIDLMKKERAQRAAMVPRHVPDLNLLEFVHWATPEFEPPYHLKPIADVIEDAIVNGGRRECFHAPVRHGKTELIKHAIVWAMLRDPSIRIVYVAFGRERAFDVSDDVRELAMRVGVVLRLDRKGVSKWKTPQGGYFKPVGIGGGLTGDGANVTFIDDPFKDRIEAESAKNREKVYTWIRGTAFNRSEPGGSILNTMARWHGDDLTGRLVDSEGDHKWPYVCLPAINEEGEALWSPPWTLEELAAKRKDEGEYNFSSLYQGDPVPASGLLFHDAIYRSDIPKTNPPELRVRAAVGVDFTWTAKQTSDYAAYVVMLRVDEEPNAYQPKARTWYFIVDAMEAQMRADPVQRNGKVVSNGFAYHINQAAERWGAKSIVTHAGAGEVTQTIHTVRTYPIKSHAIPNLHAYPGTANKLDRARPFASAWNEGIVYVRKGKRWTRVLITETCGFTGEANAKDNFVDAAVSAYTRLRSTAKGGFAGKKRTSLREMR